MGLFGKLFEKKTCAICGGEIGLLGNRKLEDGNLCKQCASKLSPWFSERRSSTVAEIAEQLEYRERNQEKVAAFHVTRTLGRYTKLLLDEDNRRFMVTSARNLAEANPDVLDYSDVTGCDLDIEESRAEEEEEEKKTETSEQQEKPAVHRPQIKRYRYNYDFYLNIYVNNPYFSRIRFRINSSTVEVEHVRETVRGLVPDPRNTPDYLEYCEMGNQMKDALTTVREQARTEAAAAQMPKQTVTCPWCGASTTPTENGCCEYCGGALKD